MQHVVRYKVRPDSADENERLVRAVYEELARLEPQGLRYVTLRLDDGVSFLHIVSSDAGRVGSMADFPAFRAFTAKIAERCAEAPVRVGADIVGAYGWVRSPTGPDVPHDPQHARP